MKSSPSSEEEMRSDLSVLQRQTERLSIEDDDRLLLGQLVSVWKEWGGCDEVRPYIGQIMVQDQELVDDAHYCGGYRSSLSEQKAALVKRFSEFIVEEGGAEFDYSEMLQEFCERESGTVLDVAIIQQATAWELWQIAKLKQGQKVTEMFFGERSCVKSRLQKYEQRNAYDHLGPAAVFPVPATLMAGVVYQTYLLLERRNYEFNKEDIVLYFVFVMGALISLVMANFVVDRLKNPRACTRMALSNMYRDLQVPEEAKSFASIAFEIQEKLQSLENMSDGEEKNVVLKELQSLVFEAQQCVEKNEKLFRQSARAYQNEEASIASAVPSLSVGLCVPDVVVEDGDVDVDEAGIRYLAPIEHLKL